MSGDHPPVPTLFGRETELDLIDRLIGGLVIDAGAAGAGADRVDAGTALGRTLLLTGEPGVGKSALLEAAAGAAAAAGVLVLRTAADGFEAGAAYSGMDRLLAPLLANQRLRPDRLTDGQRGPSPESPDPAADSAADPITVGKARLDLLRSTATERPLLLLVDDAHALDTASALSLAFVVRRLARTRVGFIAADRLAADGPLNRSGLPHRVLRPLDDAAAALLIATRFPDLAGRVHQRVLAQANGNPLALVELPTALTKGQRSGADGLPAVLPMSRRLAGPYAAALGLLPAPCRELLLMAALDDRGGIEVLETATGPAAVQRLAPAERLQLIIFERAGRLAFRHPLARTAVLELSTQAQRQRAHQALADAHAWRSNRRVWHLAEAAVRPDENIAAMLHSSAHLTLRQGDAVGAVAVLTRAAELTPDRSHRHRRLAEAAYIDAHVAGGLARVSRLLDDADGADPGVNGSLSAAIADAVVQLNGDGDVRAALGPLVAAIDRHRHREPRRAVDPELAEAMHTLLFGCFFAGRDALWEQFTARLAEVGPAVPPALSIGASTFADPARATREALARLDAMVADLRDESDPTVIVRCGMAAIYVDRLSGCRSALWRVVRDGRAGGAITCAIDALMLLCFADLAAGQWVQARRLADEALALCADHGYLLLQWPGLLAGALLSGARGEGDVVADVTARMRAWAAPRGVGIVSDYARQADALAAIGRGDFERAYRQASAVSPPGTIAPHAPHALWVMLDLVESAVRTGRQELAVGHVAAMDAAGIASISPRLALITAGCRAIAGADADAGVLFERALAVPGAERWPFELARLQLCFGELLRRHRENAAARDQFAAALQTFQRLQATPWIARASRGARATGVPVRRPAAAAAMEMSAQQRQIATLAGSGLTNKEIAERLYLSHRTVGAHLYRLYPQLGVTSRAGLRDALAGLPGAPTAASG